MSGTLSATVRYEDHVGPVVPLAQSGRACSPDWSCSRTSAGAPCAVSVVEAIEATDMATKVELWASYRSGACRSPRPGRSVSDGHRTTVSLHSV